MAQQLTQMISANERLEIRNNTKQAWETALLAEEREAQREAIRTEFLQLVGQGVGISEVVTLTRAELGKLADAYVAKVEALRELHVEMRSARAFFEHALNATAADCVTEALRVFNHGDALASAIHRAVSKALAAAPVTEDAAAVAVAEARANAARYGSVKERPNG